MNAPVQIYVIKTHARTTFLQKYIDLLQIIHEQTCLHTNRHNTEVHCLIYSLLFIYYGKSSSSSPSSIPSILRSPNSRSIFRFPVALDPVFPIFCFDSFLFLVSLWVCANHHSVFHLSSICKSKRLPNDVISLLTFHISIIE